jgi:glutathione S-transferase
MLQVYLDPCTVNSRKVLAGLQLIGMPYELRHVDYFTGAHKKPEFLAINPNGAVPAVVDGDFALSESNAILQYAADLADSDEHYPKDLKQRADINRWLLWEASTWFPSCYIYLVEYVVKPLLNTEPNEAVIEKEAPNWHRLAGILDARQIQMARRRHGHNRRHRGRGDGPSGAIRPPSRTRGSNVMTSGGTVRSIFNYTRSTGVEPEIYFYEPPHGAEPRD